jgi:ribosomal protein L37AE/L43A
VAKTSKATAHDSVNQRQVREINRQWNQSEEARKAKKRSPFKCKRCGRPLTTREARQIGYGSKCHKLQIAEDNHRSALDTLYKTTYYSPMLFQHEMPKFSYRIKGDVIILKDEGGATAVLQNMSAVLDRLNKENYTVDNAKHFLFLVQSPNGYYDGLIKDDAHPGRYLLAPFAEVDEARALKKLELAWNLGPDTNPLS